MGDLLSVWRNLAYARLAGWGGMDLIWGWIALNLKLHFTSEGIIALLKR